jgi:hypothetical protein
MKITALAAMGFGAATASSLSPTIDASEQRARDIIAQMTPQEKYGLLQGFGWTDFNPDRGVYIGNSRAGYHFSPSPLLLNYSDGMVLVFRCLGGDVEMVAVW